jgi:death-on-curing protein
VAEVRFLTLAEVLLIHDDQIRRYGGSREIRDLALLTSALAQPGAAYSGRYLHEDAFHMAAAYAFHICQNHSFVDGNKRTALASALVFLDLNGYRIDDPSGRLYGAMMEVASGSRSKEQLRAVLRRLAG